jgi:hypothetical protein
MQRKDLKLFLERTTLEGPRLERGKLVKDERSEPEGILDCFAALQLRCDRGGRKRKTKNLRNSANLCSENRGRYKWQRLYCKRTSVERVNNRLDVSFGFERHFIRGQQKMGMRCGMALCVMLALALGRARQGRLELLRSLVKAA